MQSLDLIDHARHERAGAEKPGDERFERPLDRRRVTGAGWTFAGFAQIEALLRDRAQHAKASLDEVAERPRQRQHGDARAVPIVAKRLGDEPCAADGGAGAGRSRQRASHVVVAPGLRQDPELVAPVYRENDGLGAGDFEQRGRGLATQQLRQRRCVHHPAHHRIVGIGRGADELARPGLVEEGSRRIHVAGIARGPQLEERRAGLLERAQRQRPRSGAGGQASREPAG